jgi:hypothetical protein
MKGLLVRVAADQSEGGGSWNGPVDSDTGLFVYAAIPESYPLHSGLNKPFGALSRALAGLTTTIPSHLATLDMHLDPDFDHLTYGDQGERAKQIRSKLAPGDLLVFYAGLQPISRSARLVYALIGIYVIDNLVSAHSVPVAQRHENAHTRRVLAATATDIVVRAREGVSGRLLRSIPIGDYRSGAYRVWPRLLTSWGGLSVKNGYLQRSARLPELLNAATFYDWFKALQPILVPRNN